MKTILDYALEYGQRGWAPVPLTANFKKPCLHDWPNVASSDEAYIRHVLPEKMKYNLDYLKKFSIFGDIKVMIDTVFAVIR